MKLHTFVPKKPEANHYLVAKLKTLLAQAEDGHLLGIYGVSIYSDAISTCRELRDSETPMIPAVIGGLDIIKFDLISTTAIDDEE